MDGTGREKNGWVRHTGENFDDSASERLTNVHEADIRQIMQAILHEISKSNLQPYTNNGGGRHEIHNSDDVACCSPVAVPDEPAGEEPLIWVTRFLLDDAVSRLVATHEQASVYISAIRGTKFSEVFGPLFEEYM
jgi:hypothetical protein